MERVLRKEFALSSAAIKILGVLSFVALTIAGAYIRIPIPFSPVPITLQTFFVMLGGAILGRRLGLLSQSGYLLFGIIGLPVFTVPSLFGPTGGYLVGFALAAFIIGRMLDHYSAADFKKITLAMFLGLVVLFTTGTVWLSIFLHISLIKAFALGVAPFIVGDIIKLLAAATIYQRIQKQARATF